MALRKLRSLWITAIVLWAVGCGAAADPPEQPADGANGHAEDGATPDAFEITIGRRLRVGERFRFERRQKVEKMKTETLREKRIDQERSLNVTSFAGTGEVTSVDAQGNELSFGYEIETFARSDEEGEWSLPRGTSLRVVRGLDEASAVVEIDGRAATAKERAAISIFVGLTHESVGDDNIFGTRKARRVGESWKAREDLIRAKLTGEGVTVPEKGLAASAKLIRVVPTPEGHVREIETSLSVDGFTVPDLPEGVAMKSATLSASATMVLGADGRMLENRSNRKSVIEVLVNRGSGEPSTVEIVEETMYDSRNKPVGE